MKRDFSNSTREQLIEILNNKDAFFMGDVSVDSLFSCQDASANDYIQFCDEIEECVNAANTNSIDTDVMINELINEIDTVFNAAQEKDVEYVSVVEGNIAYTTENYFSDLKALEAALDVCGANNVSIDDLESLESDNIGGVFGDPSEFEKLIENVDNPLYEEVYSKIVRDGKISYEDIGNIMQQESLSLWEMEALADVVDKYCYNPDGTLNYEELEKFIECSYVSMYRASENYSYEEYLLMGAYGDFVSYYSGYVDYAINSYDGDLLAIDVSEETYNLYNSMAVLKSTLVSTSVNYGYLRVWDDSYMDNDVWITGDNHVDFTIEHKEGYTLVGVNAEDVEKTYIYDYNKVDQADLNQEIRQLEKDIEINYGDSLKQGSYELAKKRIDKKMKDVVKKHMPYYDEFMWAVDIAKVFSGAEDDYEDLKQCQEKITYKKYISVCNVANGNNVSCNANLVVYGDDYSYMNQQIDVNSLDEYIAQFKEKVKNANPNLNTDLLTTEYVINAVNHPSGESYDYLISIGFIKE